MNVSNWQALEFRRRRAANSIPTTLAARIAKLSRTQLQRFEDGAISIPAHTLLKLHSFFMFADELLARRGKIVRFSDLENAERGFASWLSGAQTDALLNILKIGT